MSEIQILRQIEDIRRRLDYFESSALVAGKSGTWTPTITGFSADPTNTVFRYVLLGKLCIAVVRMATAGTSNSTAFTLTAPFTAATVGNGVWLTTTFFTDNSAQSATPGRANINTASDTINLYTTMTSAGTWTASGTKAANFTLIYEVA